MIKLQNIILEMVARGRPLEETLERLCLLVEELFPEVLCSILSVDRAGRVHPLAGPRLPKSYSDALDGVEIGPEVGSCGSAAFLRKEVIVTDISTDRRWTDFKHLALPIGLKACWSYPIELAAGHVAGTFAFYFRETRGPTDEEREIIEVCLHLCAIALERDERVKERERRIHSDELTGLKNRAAFDVAMLEFASETQPWGLVAFDLDNLKSTNDTFGHGAGDDLLKVVASRLADAAFPHPVFRIGGDEFAVIVKGSSADLASVAQLALSELRRPARCDQHMVAPSATAGGAVCDLEGMKPDIVRQNADLALYHAKEQNRGIYFEFHPRLRSRMTRRAGVIRRVSEALSENRIEAHYQPICRLVDRQVIGFEALCRLRTQQGALIAASHFLEATTDASVSAALTRQMLNCIARDLGGWGMESRCPPYVAINLSPADFQNSDLTALLCREMDRANIAPHCIVVEITEAVYLGAGAHIIIQQIERLKRAGFRLALDDFGTGYASLSHLLDIPVDIIKVDRTFVKKIGENKQAAAIISGLIITAYQLGLEVIAEGVETEAQLTNLISLGCESGQGYLFGRATVAKEIAELLRIGSSEHEGKVVSRSSARS